MNTDLKDKNKKRQKLGSCVSIGTCTSLFDIVDENVDQIGLHLEIMWFRSGTTCTSTRFFAKYTHFPIVFLLAQQKEELCCSETVVEAFT